MNKNNLKVIIKIVISIFFLHLVFRMIDFRQLYTILQECYLPLAILVVFIAVILSFPISFRWYLLLKEQIKGNKISYIKIWKLNMVGVFFNNFLPTGTGGDIAKAFYLVKGEEKKLFLGSSVLIDRFVGTFTVITMGVIAGLLTPDIPARIKYFLLSLLILSLFIFIVFSNRYFAGLFYSKVKRFLPHKVNVTFKNVYSAFNNYFSAKQGLFYAVLVSFALQFVAIFNNYLMAHSLLWNQPFVPPLRMFFIYIPIIWAATLIPSIGGLGVREFTYVYFFASSMGRENAFALSIIFLISVVLQSIIGAVILLFLKER